MNAASGPNQRIRSRLLALGSAATVAVYAAGFARTRSAAERFTDDDAIRRTAGPATTEPSRGAAPVAMIDGDRHLPSAPPSRRKIGAALIVATADSASSVTHDSAIVAAPVVAADSGPPVAAPVPVLADATVQPTEKQPPRIKDGTFLGWGTSRHGDIEASVEIKDGRIVAASITQCLTRYSCSWIDHLPGQVVSRQGSNVDYVSGATQSSDAFRTAIADALAKAK